jgi:tetratricopeptide (TPR) repeat protein
MVTTNHPTLDIFNKVLEKWFFASGLLLACLTITIIFLGLLPQNQQSYLFVTLLNLLILLIWFISRRPARFNKDKLGFLVCINCQNNDESKKIKEDFIFPLRQLINKVPSGSKIHFIIAKDHLTIEPLDLTSAKQLLIGTKARFLIYGRVRLREINNQNHHVLNLDGLVSHSPLSTQSQSEFAIEFGELFPSNVNINTKNDIFSFEFTSEWTGLVCRYVIALAEMVSGQIDHAEALFLDVQKGLQQKPSNFPIYRKLQARLPNRLLEIYTFKAQQAYSLWVQDHNPYDMKIVGANLDKVDESLINDPRILSLRSIWLFVEKQDPSSSLKTLKTIKGTTTFTWCLSIAFLYCFTGNLKKCSQFYYKASNFSFEAPVLSQVESFIEWAIQNYPKQYQLYYALGQYNFRVKGDLKQARADFQKFLDLGCETEYKDARAFAQLKVIELSE